MRNFFSIFIFLTVFAVEIYSDSFTNNTFNSHGVIGLVNMPTARMYEASSHGVTLYNGSPDNKITMTSFPYDWLEASFFYSQNKKIRYCGNPYDKACQQSTKDKGFNFKIRLKEEGIFPALAIGINDIAGTGYYSSEYFVGSYGINNIDFHFGIGWGNLNGSKNNFKNPLSYIHDSFTNRPTELEDEGGQFHPKRYFSGDSASPFYGVTYAPTKNLLFKVEHDATFTPGKVRYSKPKDSFSYGLEYNINANLNIGFFRERGNHISFKFIYKNNNELTNQKYEYKQSEHGDDENKYSKLIKSIESNGIGVNKIIETSKEIGIELTQYSHSNLDIVEDIIRSASFEAGINKPIKKELRVANLQALSEYNEEFEKNSMLIYKRNTKKRLVSKTNFSFRPYLASREEFFKGAFMLENNSEFIISDNLFFSYNLKYSIFDNFDDLTIPPKNTYPAQVRSDVKDYLRAFGDGIFIGRAQIDYHTTPIQNHHLMISAGILEEMFNGIGFEYLYFKKDTSYAYGFEIFDVKKRDYKMRFGTLDYKNLTGAVNLYYRNYDIIPFDAKFSYGEYLAGDEGLTIELSRSFINGTKFGVFASFTDVSSEQFGEGTFDKGIFFNIPVYGNFINYTWRPLTKDPGAKLNRKHTLHDLLIKFRPYNY